jgi:negative regulator of sigma E activity
MPMEEVEEVEEVQVVMVVLAVLAVVVVLGKTNMQEEHSQLLDLVVVKIQPLVHPIFR